MLRRIATTKRLLSKHSHRDNNFIHRFKNESASASEHKQRIVLYTSTHEKLTISRKSEEEENESNAVNVKVALSAHGFDKIGDVQEILKMMKEEKLIGMSGALCAAVLLTDLAACLAAARRLDGAL